MGVDWVAASASWCAKRRQSGFLRSAGAMYLVRARIRVRVRVRVRASGGVPP